jgi:hypothetical protein
MVYRVVVAGRIFESENHLLLLKRAVEARRLHRKSMTECSPRVSPELHSGISLERTDSCRQSIAK